MNKLLKKVSVSIILSITLISLMPASALTETTNKILAESSLSATVSEDVYSSLAEEVKETPTAIPSETPTATPTSTSTELPQETPTPIATEISTETPVATGIDVFTDVEAGEDFSTALDLPLNTEASGVLEAIGEVDYFRFDTEKTGMYIIESSATGEGCLELYDSDGVCIASDYLSSFFLNTALDSEKTFYVKITSTENSVSYSLKVNMPNDDHGYSKDSATTISLDSEVQGKLDFLDDSDYFKFTPDVDGVYNIVCSGNGEAFLNVDDNTGYNMNSGSFSAETPLSYDISLRANENYLLYVFGPEGINYNVKISKGIIQNKELLKNPSFTENTAGWYLWKEGGAIVSGSRDTEVYDSATAGYRIDCTSNGSAMHHIQFYTAGIDVQAGKTYKLSFMAKSEGGNSSPIIRLMKKTSPWTLYSVQQFVTIGSEWSKYNVYFKSNITESDARITFCLGDRIPEGGKLYIDSVSMVEYSELLTNPSFDNNTSGWAFWTESSALAKGTRDTVEFESSPAGYKIESTNKGVSMNQIQLYTWGIKVETGKRYKLTFKAKSDNGNSAPAIALMQKSSPWKSYAKYQTVSIGSGWNTYEAYFDCNTTDNDARITFYLGNRMPDNSVLYIDSLSMVEVP